MVGLALSAVTVRTPGVAGVELPLTCYRDLASGALDGATGTVDGATGTPTGRPAAIAAPGSEDLAAYAERVVRHTNRSHAGAVRGVTAGLAGSAEGLVLAAEITELTDQGFTVNWMGRDGAYSGPVSFARAARSPGELAVLLRGVLTP